MMVSRAEWIKTMIRNGMRFVPNTLEAYRFCSQQSFWLVHPSPHVQTDKVRHVSPNGVWVSHRHACSSRVVLYLHGGGYVIGSTRTHIELAGRLAKAAQAQIFMPEYRLAPEHPFPAALEDALAAYRYLLSEQIDPQRIVIAGDSAGGGLTLATLQAIRDAGLPSPACAVALSPWLDLSCSLCSQSPRRRHDPLITPERIRFFARQYASGQDPTHPGMSPLHGHMHDLPPTLIQVGEDEILLDECQAYARRARVHGSPVTLDVWPAMFHVWHFAARILPEGGHALRKIGAFVRECVPLPETDVA
ncbi:alpha/beta hydrolase [Hahella sp. SMD15-11]|uniref:Alpha/beta hydrolase n=1 Tax=Thermohahella caldifontis TaxID=3142973 RepID=A0AB39UT52_9GAMM